MPGGIGADGEKARSPTADSESRDLTRFALPFAFAARKDLELTAGDLTVQMGSAEDYYHVDLYVTYGDISGTQFGDPKGVVGNSLRKEDNGKYSLKS
jgi:hypothetical protein